MGKNFKKDAIMALLIAGIMAIGYDIIDFLMWILGKATWNSAYNIIVILLIIVYLIWERNRIWTKITLVAFWSFVLIFAQHIENGAIMMYQAKLDHPTIFIVFDVIACAIVLFVIGEYFGRKQYPYKIRIPVEIKIEMKGNEVTRVSSVPKGSTNPERDAKEETFCVIDSETITDNSKKNYPKK